MEFAGGLVLQFENGALNVADRAGQVLLRQAAASATFRDGPCVSSTDPGAEVVARADRVRLDIPGDDQRPALGWEIYAREQDSTLRIRLTVTNTTKRPLCLDRLVALESPFPFADTAPAQLVVYSPGYMSWSPHAMGKLADVAVVGGMVLAPMLTPMLAHGVTFPWVAHLDAAHLDPAHLDAAHLNTTAGHRLLAGFVESRQHVGVVEMDRKRGSLAAWNDGEGVSLPAGARRSSEELLLAFNTPMNVALNTYALAVADHKGFQKPPVPGPPPAGWCSWSAFFEHVTWQNVVDNLARAGEIKSQVGLDYFQLDDFYTRVGDWLGLHDRYLDGGASLPDGLQREECVNARMQALVQQIVDEGLTPGLWLAPILVNGKSKLFGRLGERSEWLIRDERGVALNSLVNWGAPNYSLDITHPEAEAHLRRVLRTVVRVWGFRLLKLDFLYAGALHGKRYNPDMTSVDAYNRFLQILADETAGAKILFCGAPFIESAGGAIMRIGPDVADRVGPRWDPPAQCGRERSFPAARNSVCECLTRAHWLELLYGHVDADSVILRLNGDSQLTAAERDTILATVRATNSVISLGDDLLDWTEEHTKLVRRARSPHRRAAQVVAFDQEFRPNVVRTQVSEGEIEIVVVNWKNTEDCPILDAHSIGVGEALYSVEDVYSGECRSACSGALAVGPVPAHGSRVLRLRLGPSSGRPAF